MLRDFIPRCHVDLPKKDPAGSTALQPISASDVAVGFAMIAVARLDELESVIQRGIGTFVEVGNALREIRDGKLYEPKYGQVSFETYCASRWSYNLRNHRAALQVLYIQKSAAPSDLS